MTSNIKNISLHQLESQPPSENKSLFSDRDISIVEHVMVELKVHVGDLSLSIGELFQLKKGETIKLNQVVNSPLKLYVEDRLIGYGKLVAVDDFLGFQILQIDP